MGTMNITGVNRAHYQRLDNIRLGKSKTVATLADIDKINECISALQKAKTTANPDQYNVLISRGFSMTPLYGVSSSEERR